jgi:hypothetical protein
MIRALALAAAGTLLAVAAQAGDAVELRGKGVQIYTCAPASDGFAWKFKAPEATLLDPLGQEVGRHFAGPTWQAKDGSSVVGTVEVASSGEAGAIPWLVLRAKSHSGQGEFDAVKFIVRSRTVGGVAPTGGCDKDHPGAEARTDYTAIYTFFSEQEPAKP